MSKTPKQVMMEVESLVEADGYQLGDFSMWELVGGKQITYVSSSPGDVVKATKTEDKRRAELIAAKIASL